MDSNQKYLGITIGPIIKTLSMARKPRELWSASYLFSGLMESLIKEIKDIATVMSPGILSINNTGVGLYPDRLFCKNCQYNFNKIVEIINNTKNKYATDVGIFVDYFKTYAIEIEAENDGQAIEKLNKKLDFLELYNLAISDAAESSVRKLITTKWNSQLFQLATGKSKKEIELLSEIASAQLEQIDPIAYNRCLIESKKEEEKSGKDVFIKLLKEEFNEKFKTPHKYICLVHADGDNIGTIVNTLDASKLTDFSNGFLNFGQKACLSIKKFNGLPIYVGGDDLLFIAPVISNDETGKEITIFDLIDWINTDFKNAKIPEITGVDPITKKTLIPSMSYGISITYYKYPLYEALKMSRELLFDVAKELRENRLKNGEKIKQAIAWTLRKGNGSNVNGVFSKKEAQLSLAFNNLILSINTKTDPNLISTVAHKIKLNEALLEIILQDVNQTTRLDAFFEKTLEYSNKKKSEKDYLDSVKKLLLESYTITNNIDETIKTVYTMLRTVKFIKGLEEDKDE